MQPSVPIRKDLVMVGGGHSHALVLRKMGMQPWPADVRLTLITNLADTPYSGMLPCHISGLYDFDTAHIDLRPLTRFANCRLIMDEMIGLDPAQQKVICRHHPPIAYDTLSIDTGSTPTKSQVPGAAEHAIPAKPVPNLLKAWDHYLKALHKQLIQKPHTVSKVCIVGGGVGGVEMAFAMQVRLWKLMGLHGRNPQDQVTVHIFQRGAHLAKGRNRKTQRMVERMCAERGIAVHTGESVCQVGEGYVLCDSGLTVECDRTFWVTNAAAPPWLKHSGLSLTHDGFITVEDTLQTRSHSNIFAAGDVATMANHKRPKAGVFAVRQGPPLYENLKRQVTGQGLKPFQPQRRYLNIIDTDTEKSIASWGPFAIHAKWCRAWKHSIDRKFMGLFSDFPPMSAQAESGHTGSGHTESAQALSGGAQQTHPNMHCSGCGSKVGEKVLTQALKRVRAEAPENSQWPYRNNIIAGLEEPDDAAVVQVPPGKLAVHTVDHFSALVDDPFVFGQICVNHCLSDLFAMGATSQSALAIATIPYGTNAQQEESLYQLLSGATKALANSKTFLVGGHTTEGPELSLGFACNGWIDPQHLWKKGGLEPGQSLIVTKALGTGTLFAADQQLQAKGRWIEAAIDSMLHSNQAAAACLKQHGATACTDVTGFGLAGHLLEMVSAANAVAANIGSPNIGIDLDLSELAFLPGADDTLSHNIVSSLHERNLNNAIGSFQRDRLPTHLPVFQVLFDPQTSGGLLASIPAENTTACLNELQQLGYTASGCIGSVKPLLKGSQPLTIKQW